MANLNVLYITPSKIKELSFVELNVSDDLIRKSIIDIQNIYLRPILTNKLFDSITNYIKNKTDNSELNQDFETLIYSYIQPYLSASVSIDLITNLSLRISNKGLVKSYDTNLNSTSNDDSEYFKSVLYNKLNSYKKQLIKYLQENNLIENNSCSNSSDKDITTENIGWYLQ